MYGIFTYIYHKDQPTAGNTPYMDGMGNGDEHHSSLARVFKNYNKLRELLLDICSLYDPDPRPKTKKTPTPCWYFLLLQVVLPK